MSWLSYSLLVIKSTKYDSYRSAYFLNICLVTKVEPVTSVGLDLVFCVIVSPNVWRPLSSYRPELGVLLLFSLFSCWPQSQKEKKEPHQHAEHKRQEGLNKQGRGLGKVLDGQRSVCRKGQAGPWKTPRMEIPQSLWVMCSTAYLWWKCFSLCSVRIPFLQLIPQSLILLPCASMKILAVS